MTDEGGPAFSMICSGTPHERAPDLLTDVATAYNEAATASQTPERHQAVVEIVQRILAGKNGMRL